MGRFRRWGSVGTFLATLAGAAVTGPAAFAEQAHDWQLGMQPAATPIRVHIDWLYNEVTIIIVVITAIVLFLLVFCIFRFNARRNPVPSRRTHNSLLELTWTAVPVLILIAIAIPSFKLMYFEARVPPHPFLTLKVTGHQWYWSYDYSKKDVSFDSNILSAAVDKKDHLPRLLGVNNPLVLPVGKVIRVLVTSTDVIHDWFVPSFGVQEYAVPGRENEAWIKVLRPGTYFGECNQICGVNHSFMPIEVRAVAPADFTKWLAKAKKEFASNDASPPAIGPAIPAVKSHFRLADRTVR
ncbi:MAG: cytochrome c oxidase subunit II [Stellaceae bacterium]